MSKQTPMLMSTPLSPRVYIVTRYKDLDGGKFEALEKFEVTEHFVSFVASYLETNTISGETMEIVLRQKGVPCAKCLDPTDVCDEHEENQ